MKIGRKDVAWNFAATSLRIASGVIVLPLVLRLLPSQEVGLWNIFLTIGSLAALLDFGFSNAFARNITYIFGGVQELKSEGYTTVLKTNNPEINYKLLRSVIAAMRFYYGVLAGVFLLIFVALSPFYLTKILRNFNGNTHEVWIAWFTFGFLVAYQLYTYYYGAILTGRGLVKRSLQIIILSQSIRILLTVLFLYFGFGLMSLVMGLFASDVINRTLSYYAFYDKELKLNIKNSIVMPLKDIMKIMSPNAIKIGFTAFGGFLITKVSMIIAPVYLPLNDIASFGISKQMIDLIGAIGGLWFSTFYPQITQYRVQNDFEGVKRLYLKSKLWLIFVFVVCGIGLILAGEPLLVFIHSKTHLLSQSALSLFVFIAFFDASTGFATGSLLTKNEVPFFKGLLTAGVLSLVLLMFFFMFTKFGIWGMILAPAIAQIFYQYWKWPLTMKNELNIKIKDYWLEILKLTNSTNV